PPEQERRLAFEAVARCLTNLAGPGGTALVLDDLHWADADALDLLAMVARFHAPPVRIIGAYRDTDLLPDAPPSAMLADVAHAGLAAHRSLDPLSAQEVDDLLDGLLGEMAGDTAMRRRLRERTGGVPFFVVTCAQTLRLAGAPGAAPDAVPWDVAQSV